MPERDDVYETLVRNLPETARSLRSMGPVALAARFEKAAARRLASVWSLEDELVMLEYARRHSTPTSS